MSKYRLVKLLRRAAQGVAGFAAVIRAVLLFPFLLAGLLLHPVVLQRDFYRSVGSASFFRRRFPLLEFALIGAWRYRNPHPGFQQEQLARDYPLLLLQPPVLNHVLNPNADYDLPLKPLEPLVLAPVAVTPPEPARNEPRALAAAKATPSPSALSALVASDAVDALWPLIAADTVELCREVSSLTPTNHVKNCLKRNILPNRLDASLSVVVEKLMRRFPEKVDLLYVVPWLGIRGGAERLSDRYLNALRAHYPHDRIAIFAPDAIHSHSVEAEHKIGVPVIAINDIDPNLPLPARIEIFDRIVVNLRPGTLHNASSLVGWEAFLKFGRHYIEDTRTFVTIFSDIRINDAEPVGYYHNYLPYIIDGVTGVLCDNRRIMKSAIDEFGLTRDQAAKFHFVPTPVLGMSGGAGQRELRRYGSRRPRRSLWMSRIAKEKRLDILNAVARSVPDRTISVYGATLAASEKVDMAWLDLPNIDYRGEFEKLSDLPYGEFDSYIFTTNCEGMPVSVLEATMLGLPVIAPDVGGIREIIDADTGWLVSSPVAVDEYVDALKQIESAPDEAARRVAKAQERLAAVYSYRNFVRSLETVPGFLPETAR
jgi:glycosyltransferase involved in cell wall biosynthesis